MRARLKHCSPKAVLKISNVSAPFLPSLTQNLMHTHCSCSSDIPHSMKNNKAQVQDPLRSKLTKDRGPRWDNPLSQGDIRVLGHHPANRGVLKSTHSQVKKSILEHFDHTLYASQEYGWCLQHNSKYLFRTWQIIYYAHHMLHGIPSYNPAAWMTPYTDHNKMDDLLYVYIHVHEITLLYERLITHFTGKWMMSSMFTLVCLQITLLCKQLITYITVKSMISTLCMLMCRQTDYSSPRMIYRIHDFNIRTIHTMCGFVFKRNILLRDQRELN